MSYTSCVCMLLCVIDLVLSCIQAHNRHRHWWNGIAVPRGPKRLKWAVTVTLHQCPVWVWSQRQHLIRRLPLLPRCPSSYTHTCKPVTVLHKPILFNSNAFLGANGDCSTSERLCGSSWELFFPFPTFHVTALIMTHQTCCHLTY